MFIDQGRVETFSCSFKGWLQIQGCSLTGHGRNLVALRCSSNAYQNSRVLFILSQKQNNLDSCFYVFTCVGAEFLYFFLISCIFNCAIYICNCCEVRDFGAIGCT